MRTLILDDARWYRGRGGDDSALLRRTDHKMCCLGFDAVESGLTYEEIEGCPVPSEIYDRGYDLTPESTTYHDRWQKPLEECSPEVQRLTDPSLFKRAKKLEDTVAQINDDENIDDEERLRRLRLCFAEVDIDLQLEGSRASTS